MIGKLIEAFKWREVLMAFLAGVGIVLTQWTPDMGWRAGAGLILTAVGGGTYTGIVTRKIATGIASAGLAALNKAK